MIFHHSRSNRSVPTTAPSSRLDQLVKWGAWSNFAVVSAGLPRFSNRCVLLIPFPVFHRHPEPTGNLRNSSTMFFGRLFVWVASLASGLLAISIGLVVWSWIYDQPSPAGADDIDRSSQADQRPGNDSQFGEFPTTQWSTYHPTEAWVTVCPLRQSYQRRITFSGELVAKRRTTLSFESQGRVTRMAVDKADRVQAGDVLATLDTRPLQLSLKQAIADRDRALAVLDEMVAGPRPTTLAAAMAELEALDAELRNLNRQLVRQQQLAAQNAISPSELEAIQSTTSATSKRREAAKKRLEELQEGTRKEQQAAQRATVEGLNARIELLQLQLEKATLSAPFSGVIVDSLVEQGTIVTPGQPVIQLLNPSLLEAHVGVPQLVAEQFQQQDDPYQVEMRIEDCRVHATLDRILPMVDPLTQTVLAVFRVDDVSPADPGDNAGDDIDVAGDSSSSRWVGETVYLDWQQTVRTPGYWVRNDSLTQSRRGLWSVYEFEAENNDDRSVPSADSDREPVVGTIAKQQVEVLYTRDNWSYVRGTLQPGRLIISQGTHRLLDGQRVQVRLATGRREPPGVETSSATSAQPETSETN